MKPPLKYKHLPFSKCFNLLLFVLLFTICSCNSETDHRHKMASFNEPTTAFDSISKSKVLVVGTYHFSQEDHFNELSDENQNHIQNIVNKLMDFKPTKVVIEKEIKEDSMFNSLYRQYRFNPLIIDSLPNEAYQLGFRLAHLMNHDRIYLFDNQTEFIGSLENFSFESFGEFAEVNDAGFYDLYKDVISNSYLSNQDSLKQLNLYQNILSRNSPALNNWNAQRMHAYEIRVGIQKNWIGPDWLARYYQRNLRMMANIMSYNNHGADRIVIIVGDNHKWVLDQLFSFNPEFDLQSSYEYLK